MAVSVTGPRSVNELGGPVIPGTVYTNVETNDLSLTDLLTLSESHGKVFQTL